MKKNYLKELCDMKAKLSLGELEGPLILICSRNIAYELDLELFNMCGISHDIENWKIEGFETILLYSVDVFEFVTKK